MELTVLVGISGSGKSTYAKQLAKVNPDTEIISTPTLRNKLFGNLIEGNKPDNKTRLFNIIDKLLKTNIKNNKNTIYDATNLSRKRRIYLRKVCRNFQMMV